ncbi:MAG: acetylornithine transaminase [Gammaproteobacteria bacterium]|nr:acetylornithine transaminase [Gammaproteobacteria bacterium]
MTDSLMRTYARQPVTFDRGEGVWLWDQEGRRYLDAVAGIAVCGLGHAHPAVTKALCEQAGRLVHTSNLYRIAAQEELADALRRISGMSRAFFCNSGAEANEAAIKLARLHGHGLQVDVPVVVVMEGSFHGRTLATLSATANRKVQVGFEPLVQGFLQVPYDDLEALERVARERKDVAAVLVEPVQGEGGIIVPGAGYLAGVRRICDAQGWLMMLDEIQTGIGRTGRWFAHQHDGVLPDVMTLAKGLGNGVPIGACLAHGAAAELMGPGSHGSTFGGNPLACRAALAVLETVESARLAERAEATGAYLRERLAGALQGLHCVRAVRGRGLMIGVELARPCGDLVAQARERGVLINVTAERVVRLLPPLILTRGDADLLADTLADLIREFCSRV